MKIIIVGASRGIGRDLCLLLAKEHTVYALSRNISSLIQLKNDNNISNLNILEFDTTKSNQYNSTILNQIKEADILINNAGILINKAFEQTTDQERKNIFDTNFFGICDTINLFLPILKNRNAHIVNITSMGGFQGSSKFVGLSYYSASKAALANLTECLAEEFKPYSIAVNALALGAVQTEMLHEAFPAYKAPISSENMAKFIANFATSGHQFINGKILPVSISTP